MTGMPAAAAATNNGVSGRQPGEVTTRSVPGGGSVRSCTISTGTAHPDGTARRSVTVTEAPCPTR